MNKKERIAHTTILVQGLLASGHYTDTEDGDPYLKASSGEWLAVRHAARLLDAIVESAEYEEEEA